MVREATEGRTLAWDAVEARVDPKLSFQAYYARLNALRDFLTPFSQDLLLQAWDIAASQQMTEFRRSAIVGSIIADLIRALDLREITRSDIQEGDWFVHSGVTHYSHCNNDSQTATIELPTGVKIIGFVRKECRITGTAESNMRGNDDVSLIVGRLISSTKFDLVAAGYRDPLPSMTGVNLSGPTVDFPQENVLDKIQHKHRNFVTPIRFQGISDEKMLAAATVDTIDRFRNAVENQGAWKHLYDSDLQPAHESRHQALYRLFASMTFDMFEIQVHPGANHGSGPTDLTVSLRNSIYVIEFKKDTAPQKMIHGLTVQLPQYVKSAGAQGAIYTVMCHQREPKEVEALLKEKASTLEMPDSLCSLFIEVVDCRPKMSASRA